MDETELQALFERLGVVSKGHFVLTSGRHSDEYWEKFRLLEWPRVTERLCAEMVARYSREEIEAVAGPTTGGALLAQEVARQLGRRCLVVEPAAGGGRELRRGFSLRRGERVLVVDDVLTTGLSLQETLQALLAYEPTVVGIAVLLDRSGGAAAERLSLPCQALLTVTARTYEPGACPLCAQGLPLTKPGSRGLSASGGKPS
ncbi:orotate phosphoribosyltransferase [Thermogemmatispora carboxidivorans]|uniref:orotate phosphoribosyltransferase n=1 Tax=Thermogemmatispora carboxidivorans TaxID=1382306 RepID=UPI00069CB4F9|nr:orotate phosphoribosyltransferase [Thermogemmatispora carboxidivorans]